MKALLALLCCLISPGLRAETLRASPWHDVSEARVRLLVAPSTNAEAPLRGALEIRLTRGFKTYWRNPGDSGAPPVFDFSGSIGIGPVEVAFPFPERFDDGAGGQAIGYKQDVLLPFTVQRLPGHTSAILKLSLDFAVCGTMCIPLKANLNLDPTVAPMALDMKSAFDAAFQRVPRKLLANSATETVLVRRLPSNKHPLFLISLSGREWPAETTGFIDANGHFALVNRSREGANFDLLFEAHPSPGSGGQFGAARLTFGVKSAAYDVMIDLDGAPNAP